MLRAAMEKIFPAEPMKQRMSVATAARWERTGPTGWQQGEIWPTHWEDLSVRVRLPLLGHSRTGFSGVSVMMMVEVVVVEVVEVVEVVKVVVVRSVVSCSVVLLQVVGFTLDVKLMVVAVDVEDDDDDVVAGVVAGVVVV